MKNTKKISCALIGLGRIAWQLEEDKLREKPATHTGAILSNENCILKAGCDIDQNKRILFQKYRHCLNVYSSADEMLKSHKIDIVHIATPPDSHKALIKSCVQKGIKIIICEKPLTNSLEEAVELYDYLQNKPVKVLINHERRYALPYVHTKKVIEEKKYGELLSVSAKLYMGERRSVASMLWDDGTHLIDILHYFGGGKMENVRVHQGKGADALFIVADINSISVYIEIASGRNYVQFEMDLSFGRGRIRIGNGLYEEYESKSSPYYENMRSLEWQKDILFSKTKYFSSMMNDAVKVFREKCRPVSSYEDALMTVEVMDEVIKRLNK